VLPRIIVAARRDDVLGRRLAMREADAPFVLEFCHDVESLMERVRQERPAALVVGLRGRRSAPVIALVRRIKTHCPQLPVMVACLDESAPGRDVLSAARAGAEHFVFNKIDNFHAVLRTLASPGDPLPPQRRPSFDRRDQLGGVRLRGKLWRSSANAPTRFAQRSGSSPAVLPPSISPLLRRIIQACLGPACPPDVAALARRLDLPRRSLTREAARRGWPSPRVLLQWGRLFRGAIAGSEARGAGASWNDGQRVIAHAARYRSSRTASRAFRALAGVSLRELWLDGAAALLPAFLAATGTGTSPSRLAS
jgi:hypothetical protein